MTKESHALPQELLALAADNYALEIRSGRLTLQAWDRTRNLTRRITGIGEATNARLEMTVEHFARREGKMFLLDLGRRSGEELGKRSGRLVFRERFRLFLRRQFPEWKLAEVSAEANLEFSLSPAYPRAYLKHGQHGWAVGHDGVIDHDGELVSRNVVFPPDDEITKRDSRDGTLRPLLVR